MRGRSSNGALTVFLFLLPVIFVQFSLGKTAANILVVATFLLGFLALLMRRGDLSKSMLFLAVIVIFFFLYQLRGLGMILGGGRLDALYAAPVIGAVLFASGGEMVNKVAFFRLIIAASITITAIYLLSHFFVPLPEWVFASPYAGTRWVGGFDGPNEFGQFYVLIIALALGMFLCGNIGGFYLLCVMLICGVCVWFSYSRGALAALALVLIAAAAIAILRAGKWRLLILLGLSVAATAPFFGKALDTFAYVRRGSSGREDLIEEAIAAFNTAPIFGGGFGYFNLVSAISNTTPHSDYLYFLVSGGAVGLFLLIAALLSLLFITFKKSMYVEFLFLVGAAACSVTFNNLVRGRISVLIWIMLAVILAQLVRLHSGRRTNRESPVEGG